jgi:hypothetical protein
VVSGCPVCEGASDGGGPAGDLQQAVDVFQVGAHGSLGYAEAAGDLGVGVPGGDQVQQFPVPGGEPGRRMAAALGVKVGITLIAAADGSAIWAATGSTLIKLQVKTATATQRTLRNALTFPR